MRAKNGERYTRFPKADPELRRKVGGLGESVFLDHSTSVRVSWTSSEIESAMIRAMGCVS
ncbi:MAG: hypothetical protein HN738_15055 [Gammaproteobacteria bacterium]|jgi:hypothetical protein|nr:hypothetical protein [Gammaproteobacteria bacterium]MBT6890887.1 hypothetical protein [Gammaproteobacteria bacterium]MBT7879392.1 hypothetical protein [Gammaproteobacteria bacterium]